MTYPNATVNQIDDTKISGSTLTLARIPASHDADAITLKTIFRTASSLPENAEKHFPGEDGKPVEGIQMMMFIDTIHTARCSLKGIAALSQDPRVTSIHFSFP